MIYKLTYVTETADKTLVQYIRLEHRQAESLRNFIFCLPKEVDIRIEEVES